MMSHGCTKKIDFVVLRQMKYQPWTRFVRSIYFIDASSHVKLLIPWFDTGIDSFVSQMFLHGILCYTCDLFQNEIYIVTETSKKMRRRTEQHINEMMHGLVNFFGQAYTHTVKSSEVNPLSLQKKTKTRKISTIVCKKKAGIYVQMLCTIINSISWILWLLFPL